MATTAVTLNGVTYFVPQPGEQGPTYDQDLTNYLIALATAFPQGGSSPSSTFQALVSATANPATAGSIRLAKTDLIDWRNNANTGNLPLGIDTLDDLTFNGVLVTGQPMAQYQTNASQNIPNGAFTIVNFGTLVRDTDTAVTTGASWHFTVPAGKSGDYLVTANVRFTGLVANNGIFQLAIFANASQSIAGAALDASNGNTQGVQVAGVINLTAGSTIDVRVFQSQAAAHTLTGTFSDNNISIKRLV